ncbi:hypothetical protein GQE99_02360 [Maritimibacter sp. DP07]|uniref:Uncharacterized protein n=1 Tax=Maritimibacter harenae TaxID=2606218 RepID=A0A845M0H9_9RHOB|nr:hypothetical protein [Maritimibacter harenae]
MQRSEARWQPRRIALFLGLLALLYGVLFVAADQILRAKSARNPFHRIAMAPAEVDWIVLGASHALPLSMGDMPKVIAARTGADMLSLALTGGGPFTARLIADRFFADHRASGVLVVVDRFTFLDERWNAGRIDDADVLPKIPADRRTLAAFMRAVPHGLPTGALAAYATGFARINDHDRLKRDVWEAEARFDTSPRPSPAADAARLDYLYPGPPDETARAAALAEFEGLVDLARTNGAQVVLVCPPLPDRFRARLPATPELDAALIDIVARHDLTFVDFEAAVPEPASYFDTDHLNRNGVGQWLDAGLAALLAGTGAARAPGFKARRR